MGVCVFLFYSDFRRGGRCRKAFCSARALSQQEAVAEATNLAGNDGGLLYGSCQRWSDTRTGLATACS